MGAAKYVVVKAKWQALHGGQSGDEVGEVGEVKFTNTFGEKFVEKCMSLKTKHVLSR